MTRMRFQLAAVLLAFCLGRAAFGQTETTIKFESANERGRVELNTRTGRITATNGVIASYSNLVLTAESASLDQTSGDITADGGVRIQMEDQLWTGEHIRFNFKTRQMSSDEFRTGKFPLFAAGAGLTADTTGHVYTARSSYITTDDVSEPFQKIRCSRLTIVPGKYIEARDAVVYLGDVPVFYFPYYYTRFDRRNYFWITPGYRTHFGAYLLGNYSWVASEQIEGRVHADYRSLRGFGGGLDTDLHLGRWGESTFKYYYLNDDDPTASSPGFTLPADRQRFEFTHLSAPYTNFTVRSTVAWFSDERLQHDFFESEHRRDPQPATFVQLEKLWPNFSLELYAQPRVNEFLETVERLPEVKLTAFRQQLGTLPVYYESESSVGWYHRRFAETNGVLTGLDYSAARADTFHQLTAPRTFFGWLNFTPRVGGRLSAYSDAGGPGGTNDEAYRGVFNTGAEISFKASRVWRGATNGWFDVDGLRHIVEPSVNYVFVPQPHPASSQLPAFDYTLPSLRLRPIEYPDFNSIDSIDSQNVLRLGLRNRLQTKRHGAVQDLLNWELYTDWRLNPDAGQTTFADLFSDLKFSPRDWITLESAVRYDLETGHFRLALHELTLSPNDRWSWGLAHWYVRDDLSGSPEALGEGNNLFRSTLFYRLNENWGFRASHFFEASTGRLEEQFYTIYRDLRSWTGALTLRVRDNLVGGDDITVALAFSLKAAPKYHLGEDAVSPERLLER
ncbi:MAG: LPS-assembly protein LptD [Verrucomicrobia bacterium]|nr:MAG: LPS-assembly protein LptD [Verrucomicrobiota bacterium]